jgi:hypothetical protein
MAGYKVLADSEMGYNVEVTSPDRFLLVRGFMTEFDARAWVAEQQIAEDAIAEAKGVVGRARRS